MLLSIWDVLKFLDYLPVFEKFYSRFEKQSRNKSWGQILRMLENLAEQIRAEPYQPDVVVGAAREGALIASIFAINWRYKPLCVVDRETYLDGDTVILKMLNTASDEFIKGKKVLLIDGECNSGQTLKVAKDYLIQEKSAAEVRTMVLGKSITSTFQPDYFYFEYQERPNWAWVYTDVYKRRRKEHYKPSRRL